MEQPIKNPMRRGRPGLSAVEGAVLLAGAEQIRMVAVVKKETWRKIQEVSAEKGLLTGEALDLLLARLPG
jgi:hypothetical protein